MRSVEDIRAELDHPIIDCDGHVREFMPAVLPFLRESLGQPLFDRYLEDGLALDRSYRGGGTAERERTRAPVGAWWAVPSENTLDRATAMTPRLMYERLDELGIDFAVLYPTMSMGTTGLDDEELRRGLCRGFNEFYAATYGRYADRMALAGVLPMHTPAEAIEELEHCAALGLKVATIPHGVRRPIPEPQLDAGSAYLWPGQTHWFDTFALDSIHDYDPVWRRFVELGFAVTAHGGMTLPIGAYTSITSFTYNHIGSHAAMMYPLCKSLFLGGVTRRFPELPFAFLECGVAWACTLLHDLVEHWEHRSAERIQWTNPANLDVQALEELMRANAGDFPELEPRLPELLAPLATPHVTPDEIDEWVHTGATGARDICELFSGPFYFGCESDDRTLAFAFSPANPLGTRLQPVFSSDIGHWDVRDMRSVVPQAHALVEEKLITPDDFADLVYRNPLRLLTQANPHFFDGTALEG